MLSTALKRFIHTTSGQAVIDLCRPLIECFGIHYMLYVRDYKNGKRIWLTTHGEWTEHFYQHNLYEVSAFENSSISFQPGSYLWSTLPGQKVFNIAREFNIDHGMTLVTEHQDYYEFFHFAATPDNAKVLNLYMNNPEVLQKFSAYFVGRAKNLIKNANSCMVDIPQPSTFDKMSWDIIDNSAIQDFLYNIDSDKCYLKTMTEEVHLTKREVECLNWSLKGKSMQEIALIVGISKRTVETHLEQVKCKLHCYKSFQLGYKLAKMGFSNYT